MYKWKLITINDVRDNSEYCFNYNLEEFLNKNKVIDYKIIYSIKYTNGRISTADILYKVKIKSKNIFYRNNLRGLYYYCGKIARW